MIHEILPVGALACNCSIFGEEAGRTAMVIDPGDDVDDILALVERHHLRVASIVITHAHLDHVGGVAELKKATGAPVYMDALDEPLYDRIEIQASWLGLPVPEKVAIDTKICEGDEITLGETKFMVLETPGHSPGSISLWIPSLNKVMCGDTLFRDSMGRTDLPGGDSRTLLRSIQSKLLALPEETQVVPGHGPLTTIGREKVYNPFLQGL
ncbi:MAG: MBL fold metallo-hydrolase [Acidobacteriales bacterium]|nr:MBL fold metallo-hydrolase [Terriglobales bacterium]